MGSFADDSLVSDFVTESRENLDAIEPDLLAMEQEGSDVSQETINSVFRAIHSMKGGAGFLAFENLKRLSHTMESVLMLVRDGKMAVSHELMDVLLAGVDRLRAMVDDIQASDSIPIEEDLARLNAILGEKGVAPNAQVKAQTVQTASRKEDAPPPAEFDLSAVDVRNALEHGMFLYSATAYIHRDIQSKNITPVDFLKNIESLGRCLETSVELDALPDLEHALEQDFAFTFLFATVLEEDLVATALELPEDQIAALDTKALKENLSMDATPEKQAAAEEVPEEGEPGIAESSEPSSVKQAAAAPAKKQEVAETLRVRVDLLTRLMNTAGELVLGRNQLLRALEGRQDEVSGLPAILQNIDLVTTELQEGIMQTRMQPIGAVFGRFTRVVRDMARDLGKEIDLKVEGSEVELDKSIIELLGDPLTHIIRNCCDHAIEPPAERKKKGKPAMGHVMLRAFHEGGQVNISVTDDGRGIDSKKVLQKALEKGVVARSDVERMTERDIVNLVFAPGFSTAEVVSEVSGRGVGMDVVRTNIEKLGGHVDVETAVDQGTTVLLRLPLTLAIIPSLIVGVEGHRFAVPQVNLVELVWVRAAEVAQRIERVHGADVLRLRGRLLPLVRLCDTLGIERTYLDAGTGERHPDRRERLADKRSPDTDRAPAEGERDHVERSGTDRRHSWRGDYNILVLQVGSNQLGVIVDELFDSEEIVVKPLSSFIKECKCFAGATILGDGRVIMILDAGGVAEQAGLHFTDLDAEEKRRKEEEAIREAAAAAARRSIILFNSAPSEFFAVPQERVLRLERVEVSQIEEMGGKEFVQYRGAGLPLVRLENVLNVSPLPAEAAALFLIIPKPDGDSGAGRAKGGILVSRIVDALDVEVALEESSLSGPGLQGSAIVHDKLTIFLDPAELLDAAGVTGGA